MLPSDSPTKGLILSNFEPLWPPRRLLKNIFLFRANLEKRKTQRMEAQGRWITHGRASFPSTESLARSNLE